MKKFLAKLALYTFTSILLTISFNMQLSQAEDPIDKKEFLDEADKLSQNPCISMAEKDQGYIVTIIEEPLNNEKKGNPGDNFIQRPCYRHTFQINLDGKRETYSEITSGAGSENCSETFKTLAETHKDEYKAAYSCKPVQAILSKGGTSMIYGYIGMIYQWGASMVGIIAVLVIVISGIQISAGGGDPEAINSAKKRILQSLAGIAVLFLSGLILYTINPDFFVK